MMLNDIVKNLLKEVSGIAEIPANAAFNIRNNSKSEGRHSTENIDIVPKEGGSGLDIYVKPFTKNENVHIPALITQDGVSEVVYNDFHIGEGAEIEIIAGCGIHNCGDQDSEHDGIHRFFVGKNARVKYVEKHYGEGNGTGARVLNPVTNIFVGENSVFTLDTAQIKGVDSTVRETNVELGKDAKLYVTERLMTDGEQKAESNIEVQLNGEDSSAQIVSRSVGKGNSVQTFHPNAIGNSKCQAHIQCDSIIMDHAEVGSIPEIRAKNIDAAIIHEAAIGRINHEHSIPQSIKIFFPAACSK